MPSPPCTSPASRSRSRRARRAPRAPADRRQLGEPALSRGGRLDGGLRGVVAASKNPRSRNCLAIRRAVGRCASATAGMIPRTNVKPGLGVTSVHDPSVSRSRELRTRNLLWTARDDLQRGRADAARIRYSVGPWTCPPAHPNIPPCKRRAGSRARSASSRTAGAATAIRSASRSGVPDAARDGLDPEVIRALYGERGHKMPPGRQITLKPLVGARSLLLLEGSEHLSRRKVMLPPFHGDRMRAYEPIMREAAEHELDGWPEGRAFAVHPSMQAITLEVILRAVFGTRDERPARTVAQPARGDDLDRAAGVRDVRAAQAARAAAGDGAGHRPAAVRGDRAAAAVTRRGHLLAARAARAGTTWRSATS